MGKLRQQLVRRLRLLLTVWLLALVWAPVAGAADVALHARVVQIATTCPQASVAHVAAPRARAVPALRALRVTLPQLAARASVPREPGAAWRLAHGPSFDGRSLYLDLRTLLR
ncbi:MAG: hypothetical protein ABW217_19440 [Polyangiaceae bacterium]